MVTLIRALTLSKLESCVASSLFKMNIIAKNFLYPALKLLSVKVLGMVEITLALILEVQIGHMYQSIYTENTGPSDL